MQEASEESAYHELYAWSLSRRDGGFVHQFIADCWVLQNSTAETKPIGTVFSLISLCLHLEHGYTGGQVQLAHMRLARRRKDWPRIIPPAKPVKFSVREILEGEEDATRDQTRDRWCESVWECWRDSHQAIRELVKQELSIVGDGRFLR